MQPPSPRNPYEPILVFPPDQHHGTLSYEEPDGSGRQFMALTRAGTYFAFENLDFGAEPGVLEFVARIRARDDAGLVELRLDGPHGVKIGELATSMSDTGAGWVTVTTGAYGVTGVRTLCLVNASPRSLPFDLESFHFVRGAVAAAPRIAGLALPPQVPHLGPPEPSFIGTGRIGAGGDVAGSWDYLIGPTYTHESQNFIREATLGVVIDGVTHTGVWSLHRARGSGVYYGVKRIGDLTVACVDVAPNGQPWLARVLLVDATDAAGPHTVAAVATVHPAPPGKILWMHNKGTATERVGDCALDMRQEDIYRIAVSWSESAAPVIEQAGAFVLATTPAILAPGQCRVSGLYHVGHDPSVPAEAALAGIRGRDVARDVADSLAEWTSWLAGGRDLNLFADPRARDIVESNLVNIRMLQGADGGILETPRAYPICFPRGSHTALRGLMTAGHTAETARFIRWVHGKYLQLKGEGVFRIPNCADIGGKGYFCGFGNEDNWSAETPALYLLVMRHYLRLTGDLDTLVACDESLRYALDVQIRYGRAHDWRLLFHGDETESGGSGIILDDWPSKWSMTSVLMAINAADFAADYLRRVGDEPARAEAEEAARQFRAALDRHFWREELGLYDWYRGPDGEWPRRRLTSYHLFPIYFQTRLEVPQRARQSAMAMKAFVNARGYLPLQPGGLNGDFCGHASGYLLIALTELDDPLRHAVYEALVAPGLVGCWGTWSEAYNADGRAYHNTRDNRIHNLRPFESGVNLEALFKYWEKETQSQDANKKDRV